MDDKYNEFTLLIAQINRGVGKIKTEEMAKYGLKGSHVSCLYYLYICGGMTAKKLCDVCGEDKAAVSRAVAYLQKNGYLLPADEKRYNAPLTLTEKGESAAEYVCGKVKDLLARAGDGLTAEARAALYEGLKTIAENLKEICNGYGEHHGD